MRIVKIPVGAEHEGKTVKQMISSNISLSSKALTKIKYSENGIMLNGVRVTVRTAVHAGDLLKLNLDTGMKSSLILQEGPLDILYEDNDVLILSKPPFMETHPSRGKPVGTLANFAAFYLEKNGYEPVFRPVNRLDRDTSGVVCAAKNRHAHGYIVKNGNTYKEYIAVARGVIECPGVIDAPLERSEEGISRAATDSGLYAVTRYEPLGSLNGDTVLRVVIETGRTHQIRAHLAHIGHPVAGDTLYGGGGGYEKRQLLHAYRFEFDHPVTGKRVKITAPLFEDMAHIVEFLVKDEYYK